MIEFLDETFRISYFQDILFGVSEKISAHWPLVGPFKLLEVRGSKTKKEERSRSSPFSWLSSQGWGQGIGEGLWEK